MRNPKFSPGQVAVVWWVLPTFLGRHRRGDVVLILKSHVLKGVAYDQEEVDVHDVLTSGGRW